MSERYVCECGSEHFFSEQEGYAIFVDEVEKSNKSTNTSIYCLECNKKHQVNNSDIKNTRFISFSIGA